MRSLFLILFVFAAWSVSAAEPPSLPQSLSGEVLARANCATCHLYPDPSLLPKSVWTNEILPKMRLYMGLDKPDLEKGGKEVGLMFERGIFPAAPLIPEDAWRRIESFYVARSIDWTNTPPRNDQISIGVKNFKVQRPKHRRSPPITTLVQIGQDGVIFTSDATLQTFDVLSPTTELLASFPVGNIITSAAAVTNGFFITGIGHFFPSEERRGQVMFLERSGNSLVRSIVLSDLPRVAHLELADLNNDGRQDFALSMFGFMTGRFSWFEAEDDLKFKEHVLFDKPGAVKSVAHDFNRDGHLDLAVLFGQTTDGLLLFTNDGKGRFSMSEIFRRPPSYGHAYFELADFNKDGEMEFLVVNGDNGDYESPPKPYHGIRIYTRDGDKWKETFFFPLHGAFKAVARDFDEDGDLDIACVSFFPDYEKSPRESFVYLENNGSQSFTPSTFREVIAGRWMTLDAGDLDGDGDIDLALGSMTEMPTVVPEFLKTSWAKGGPSVLVLLNQLRQPAPTPSTNAPRFLPDEFFRDFPP